MTVINAIINGLALIVLAPLVAGIIKTAKARMQNRRGPSLLQPYFDLFKLFRKGGVVSPTVSWLFLVAPVIYFGAAAATAFIVAPGEAAALSDLFLLIYLFGMGRFFLALASLDAGSTFGGMGGSREMYLAVLVEPALVLALLTVAVQTGGLGLAAMAGAAGGLPLSLAQILAAIAFFIVVVAETGRIPVDNPDTHLELTMIHEGMVLEYSGSRLGLILWASMVKQLVVLVLFVSFFMPWGLPQLQGALPETLWFAVKLLIAALLLAVTETSTNKMRLFRLPGFLAVSCLLSLLALVAQ